MRRDLGPSDARPVELERPPSCRGFWNKVEPLVGNGGLSEAYFNGSIGPTSTAVTRASRWRTANSDSATIAHYYAHSGTVPTGTSLNGIGATTTRVGLGSNIAINGPMWEYVNSAWTSSDTAGSLYTEYSFLLESFPTTERTVSFSSGGFGDPRSTSYMYASGRDNKGSELFVRRCASPLLAVNSWSCDFDTIATAPVRPRAQPSSTANGQRRHGKLLEDH